MILTTTQLYVVIIRVALTLIGLSSAIWLQAHSFEFGYVNGSVYTRCIELAGWPEPYYQRGKRISWQGEVDYSVPKWRFRPGILDCSVLVIHAFAVVATAWLLRPSLRFTVGTTIAITAGIGTGLGVYCSLPYPEGMQDILASAGIGVAAFWGTQLLISWLNSKRQAGLSDRIVRENKGVRSIY